MKVTISCNINEDSVGEEYLLVRVYSAVVYSDKGEYNLWSPSAAKKWHGHTSDLGRYWNAYGVRRVLSFEKKPNGKYWVWLSDDLCPDHP